VNGARNQEKTLAPTNSSPGKGHRRLEMNVELLTHQPTTVNVDNASATEEIKARVTESPRSEHPWQKWFQPRRIARLVWHLPVVAIGTIIVSPLVPVMLLMHLTKMLHAMAEDIRDCG
jgi:hypothetical protein